MLTGYVTAENKYFIVSESVYAIRRDSLSRDVYRYFLHEVTFFKVLLSTAYSFIPTLTITTFTLEHLYCSFNGCLKLHAVDNTHLASFFLYILVCTDIGEDPSVSPEFINQLLHLYAIPDL